MIQSVWKIINTNKYLQNLNDPIREIKDNKKIKYNDQATYYVKYNE